MSFKATYRTRAFRQGTPLASRTRPAPTMRYENQLRSEGVQLIAGVDEVGVGAWAGPVAVGVVILHPGRRLYKVRDSKLLDAPRRQYLADHVKRQCLTWSVGLCWPDEIDEHGLSFGTMEAARRALRGLSVEPHAYLVDGNWNFLKLDSVKTIVRGDSESVSIASASLVAKIARDALMQQMASLYPFYGFNLNKGYPSPDHKWALAAFGPCPIHRRLFEPVRVLAEVSVPGRLLPQAVGSPSSND
jgi:ribonuclease HII